MLHIWQKKLFPSQSRLGVSGVIGLCHCRVPSIPGVIALCHCRVPNAPGLIALCDCRVPSVPVF